jgi:hypothetical protein
MTLFFCSYRYSHRRDDDDNIDRCCSFGISSRRCCQVLRVVRPRSATVSLCPRRIGHQKQKKQKQKEQKKQKRRTVCVATSIAAKTKRTFFLFFFFFFSPSSRSLSLSLLSVAYFPEKRHFVSGEIRIKKRTKKFNKKKKWVGATAKNQRKRERKRRRKRRKPAPGAC